MNAFIGFNEIRTVDFFLFEAFFLSSQASDSSEIEVI